MGYPVLFVTIESPAPFVAAGLRQRAMAMGIDYEAVQDRIVLVDAASYAILRHSLPHLAEHPFPCHQNLRDQIPRC